LSLYKDLGGDPEAALCLLLSLLQEEASLRPSLSSLLLRPQASWSPFSSLPGPPSLDPKYSPEERQRLWLHNNGVARKEFQEAEIFFRNIYEPGEGTKYSCKLCSTCTGMVCEHFFECPKFSKIGFGLTILLFLKKEIFYLNGGKRASKNFPKKFPKISGKIYFTSCPKKIF
jgi:hypothetical protein